MLNKFKICLCVLMLSALGCWALSSAAENLNATITINSIESTSFNKRKMMDDNLLFKVVGRNDPNEVFAPKQHILGQMMDEDTFPDGEYQITAYTTKEISVVPSLRLGWSHNIELNQCYNPTRPNRNIGYEIMISNKKDHDLHGKVCPHHFCKSYASSPMNNRGGDKDYCTSFCVKSYDSNGIMNHYEDNRILSVWIADSRDPC